MSATAALRIDAADPTPPYEQLRRQLVHLVGVGALSPGDRLPPVRQLAADLGLATGTAARAYRELEAAGLVVSRRGGGTRVAQGAARRPAAQVRASVRAAAAAYVQQGRLLGAGDDDLRTALDEALRAAEEARTTVR